MKHMNQILISMKFVLTTVAVFACVTSSAVTIPNTPLDTQITAKPMVMLVASKDHKLFFEAYNDASDLDRDGKLEIRFKPTITYYGLYNSTLCYSYSGSGSSGLFSPHSKTSSGICPGVSSDEGQWSGNWLNYVTTSRIDSLRKVLYGGYREVDTSTETVLRRAYIPQDGHSWAKEYTSKTNDGYDISDYTPLSVPSASKRHFFGGLTANAYPVCASESACNEKLPPLLSIVTNSTKRVWEWASKQQPVLDDTHGGARVDYTVRVKVCTTTFNDGCKQYGSNFKPIGLLHEYGENDSMLFGLLTGSYDKNMSGGVLRKVVSKFSTEVDSSTGQFKSNATIVSNFNNLRIRDFNNGTSGAYRKGSFRTGPMVEGDYVDWGNPVGEMMYETMRYFGGAKSATAAFDTSGTHDSAVGLTRVSAWDNPYESTSSAAAPYCARSSMLVMSDVYPSYDADQVPGSAYSSMTDAKFPSLNVSKLLDQISNTELNVTGSRFIGQSTDSNLDYAPTAKPVTTLSTLRGLAPEETTKQGSYSSAGVAYFGKTNDINASAKEKQTINSYFLALSSTLPKIEIPVNGKLIKIIPFAKTIDGASTDRAKGKYQPTDAIVDLYVTQDDLTPTGGTMKFLINFEADEQGNDFDMDVNTEYTIENNNGSITVKVEVKYQGTGSNQNVGYVVSGSNRDGIYLVATDKLESLGYFLNVPPTRNAGYCDNATNIALAECKQLPRLGGTTPISTQTFTTGTTLAGEFLKDPLWYAAKWGGFSDKNNNSKPDLSSEWDADGNGSPDNYFLVQNPLELRDSLKRAFDAISAVNSSASNVIANSSNVTTNSRVFQARFDAEFWTGDLVAYPVTASGVSSTTDWEASSKVPLPSARKLFVRTIGDNTKEFLWDKLATEDKNLLDTDLSLSVDTSQDVVNYLRGVRTKELQFSGGFRDRTKKIEGLGDLLQPSPLGDIVHSSPFYEKGSDTIFVSANDGMLHGFKASNGIVAGSAGTELFGFIPSEVLSRLKNLTSTGYSHEYFVDGDIAVSPKVSETGNKNFLFAALGRGGKGLFSLDVTNPSAFGASDFLWEYTPTGDSSATTDGVMDTTTNAATDLDLGYMLGRPVYATMNNGQAAVIVGNGYNSTSGKAVLYIFLLNSSGKVTQVKKIDTLVGSDNGLASPGVFNSDNDGNGTIDYIYAGDLKGNVWKFDVSGATVASWSLSLGGTPLFVAKNASNQIQPITAPITVAVDTVAGDTHEGKRFVFFGSGSYFLTGDPADTKVQTWYGLIDESAAITSRTDLRARTIAATGTFNGKPVRAFSSSTLGDMVGKKGWYLDFTSPAGERMITEPVLYKLATSVLVASSIIPTASDPCTPGGTGYVNIIGPFNGAALSVGILDINDNKNYTDDLLGTLSIGSVDLGIGLPSRPILIGKRLVTGGTASEAEKRIDDVGVNTGALSVKGRMSWREIIKD